MNRLLTSALLVAMGLGLAACSHEEGVDDPNVIPEGYEVKSQETPAQGADQPADSTAVEPVTKTIGLDEVAQHASKEDCWMAIAGKVYDLSPFIAMGQHKPVIVDGCGRDATTIFEGRNGKGEHPEQAQASLPNYLIGDLAQ